METSRIQLSADLGPWAIGGTLALVAFALVLLVIEVRRAPRLNWPVLLTGWLATAALALTVLRPAKVQARIEGTPARVIALVDAAERRELPAERGRTRKENTSAALVELSKAFPGGQLAFFGFGEHGAPEALASLDTGLPQTESRFLEALQATMHAEGTAPGAVVLVSDGRLTTPQGAEGSLLDKSAALKAGLPIHTIRLSERAPKDRAIRQLSFPQAVLAHEPFALTVTVSCSAGLNCSDVPVVIREPLQGGVQELGRGSAQMPPGSKDESVAQVTLQIQLERAGNRLLEVALEPAPGDEVPDNDRAFAEVLVRRDRTRLLHVAGRPTYDVRALRTFLKSDRSIDLISFFILRTTGDRVNAASSELALIPFPVDELFEEHLPSFDAVILQDINAVEYGVSAHFRSLREYVRHGGGLILVGGPDSFAAGGYADSPLADVLPVRIPSVPEPVHAHPFVPRYTAAGAQSMALGPLRNILGDRLPTMAGANWIGAAKPGAVVLWDHPNLAAAGEATASGMPLLALQDVGDGRAIALSVDATHKLRMGQAGLESGGRAYGALWEGLLGWLMRDPRYEAARLRRLSPCVPGRRLALEVTAPPGLREPIALDLEPLGESSAATIPISVERTASPGGTRFELTAPPTGSYAAVARIGRSAPTRVVFGCLPGGGAYADSRPDPERLRRISRESGGVSVLWSDAAQLPPAREARVIAQSSSEPLAPDWAWSTAAALLMGAHVLLRRREGLL